ncbi:Glu/Leu/Phe/Val dehydrogenase [Lactonifactor longoviformis]|uniref:Glu/Leu/Phe/Val family dehydrogenase n=1 Tax=Lactonifactor longoviformis TaxID=341220 RepID=UPI00210D6229|nr:Glu/Leu/Phe/Val dehydrogenase dimerization domain-containing protein [Lactonifactor longoviformis]MCQ4672039.1 Glu/Leu/Phe/Val dehydrogenase [Lactonifactor longoviformis]
MRDPYVVIEWSDRKSEAKGWLVIDSIRDEFAAGGLRMNVTVNREEVERLAQVMSYKYVAAEAEIGGAKGGIIYDYHKENALEVMERYLEAMKPYLENGITVGADLGTRAEDVRRIKQKLGIQEKEPKTIRENPDLAARSQEVIPQILNETVEGLDMDRFVTGYGVAVAADEGWKLTCGTPGATVAIQGFGSVGGSAALWLEKLGYKVVAIADIKGMYYNEEGLDIRDLLDARNKLGEVDLDKMKSRCQVRDRDAWLDLDVDILIPAAVEDVITREAAETLKAGLIVEGANIPTTPEADEVIKQRGIHLVPDFIANLGSVCFFNSIESRKCEPTPQGVMDRLEDVIRRDVQKTFAYASEHKIYARDAAWILFKPEM